MRSQPKPAPRIGLAWRIDLRPDPTSPAVPQRRYRGLQRWFNALAEGHSCQISEILSHAAAALELVRTGILQETLNEGDPIPSRRGPFAPEIVGFAAKGYTDIEVNVANGQAGRGAGRDAGQPIRQRSCGALGETNKLKERHLSGGP